jgi:hypothetical protein
MALVLVWAKSEGACLGWQENVTSERFGITKKAVRSDGTTARQHLLAAAVTSPKI